jgi:hypothetical protein
LCLSVGAIQIYIIYEKKLDILHSKEKYVHILAKLSKRLDRIYQFGKMLADQSCVI